MLVIVVGLGVGVLSSVMLHRGSPSTNLPLAPTTQVPGGAPAVTPAPALSLAPTLTPAPLPSFTTKPTERPSPKPAATPHRSPAPAALPSATAGITPLPTAPAPERTKAASPAPVATPLASTAPSALPERGTPVPPASTPAGNGLLDGAQGVVRKYVNAVMHGDATGARAMLGGSTASAPLPELQFALPSSRIVSVIARRTGDNTAAVEVQLANGQATYLLVYAVTQTANGYFITGRDVTRPY